MTDVQFMHFRQCGNGLHIVIGQAMTGVHSQPQACRKRRRFGDARQFLRLLSIRFGIRITAGMDFNVRCANVRSGFNLFFIGINEQRYQNMSTRSPAPSQAAPWRRFC